MTRKKLLATCLKVIPWLIPLAITWAALTSTQLGGRSETIIVTDNSMEPLLQRGDLAVMRQTGAYQVGDVVVYTHPSLGAVIHRIVAVEASRFILRGDHSSWTDSYQPTEAEIKGELWFSLPHAGRIAQGLRTPLGAALLAVLVGIILFWPETEDAELQATAR